MKKMGTKLAYKRIVTTLPSVSMRNITDNNGWKRNIYT